MKKTILLFAFAFFTYFLSWFVLYKTNINTLPIQSEDTLPAMFIPVSVLKHRTLYLDEYYEMMNDRYPHPDNEKEGRELTPFYLRKVEIQDGESIKTHYVSAFPIVTPLLSLPVYAVPVLAGIQITWDNLIILSHISSALIIAFSGVVLYRLLIKHFFFERTKRSLFLTGIYLFATVNLPMLSQGLWQHGTLELFVILGLFFLYEYFDHSKWYHILLSGLFFGVSVLTRPTAGLVFLAVILLVYMKKGYDVVGTAKGILLYFLGLLPSILFFFWYNAAYYKDIANQGYSDQLFSGWLGGFPESFFGIWLSPSKGILMYTPIFIFSIAGIYISLRQKQDKRKDYFIFGLIILLHTLVMSFWKHWFGGYSYGYRMASDVIPFLVLLLVPFISSVYFVKFKKLFFLLLFLSLLMQSLGLIFFDGIWHNAYDKGFTDTGWLWSFQDSELAFNVRRVLVKFGMLEKACPQCLPGS